MVWLQVTAIALGSFALAYVHTQLDKQKNEREVKSKHSPGGHPDIKQLPRPDPAQQGGVKKTLFGAQLFKTAASKLKK